MVKCDFFKLFPTKLSRINPYTNLIVNAKAMDVAQPIWLSGCPKKVISELEIQFNVSNTTHNFVKVSTNLKVSCLDGQIPSSYFFWSIM